MERWTIFKYNSFLFKEAICKTPLRGCEKAITVWLYLVVVWGLLN
jgi:hypothetical protein